MGAVKGRTALDRSQTYRRMRAYVSAAGNAGGGRLKRERFLAKVAWAAKRYFVKAWLAWKPQTRSSKKSVRYTEKTRRPRSAGRWISACRRTVSSSGTRASPTSRSVPRRRDPHRPGDGRRHDHGGRAPRRPRRHVSDLRRREKHVRRVRREAGGRGDETLAPRLFRARSGRPRARGRCSWPWPTTSGSS